MGSCKILEVGECPMFSTTTSHNNLDSRNTCYNFIPIFKSAIYSITDGNNSNFCNSIALQNCQLFFLADDGTAIIQPTFTMWKLKVLPQFGIRVPFFLR